MKESKNKVLIICWSFPPNPGIGGRRWAKFAKYLQLEGYEVYVIKSSNLTSDISTWSLDVDQGRLKVYELKPQRYAQWLIGGTSVLQKIQHRIARFILYRTTKGTIYDAALGVENETVQLIDKVISEHSITKVIATGAPFNLLYYTAKAICKYKNIISIADYRDPWIDAENYGMKNLNPKRMKFEQEKQNKILETFSYITAPYSFLIQQIRNTYTANADHIAEFVELSHAYDSDSYKDIIPGTTATNKFTIAYGGTMYIGIEKYLNILSEAASVFNEKNKTIKLEINFYTENHLDYLGKFQEINFYPRLKKDFFKMLNSADMLVILCAEHNKNYKTTKYFEYLPLEKPLLFIGPDGFVSQTIENEKTGIVLRTTEDLIQFVQTKQEFKPNKDFKKHSFKERTQEVIRLLELETVS